MQLRQLFPYVLVALLCLPLLFINIKDSHDWGDDFAQYIAQAKNIAEGTPQAETGFIPNDDVFIGPPAYPAGFPLMLAPIYSLCGNSIEAFATFISALLFLFCITCFHFLRKHLSSFTAIILVLLIAHNPWTWSYKTEVTSDIPFSFLLIVCACGYLYAPRRIAYAILIGITAGLLISTRSIGLVFPLAIMMDAALNAWRDKHDGNKVLVKKELTWPAILLVVSVTSYIVISYVLFPLPSGDAIQYPKIIDLENFWTIAGRNLKYNTEVMQAFFAPYSPSWNFFSGLITSSVLVFLVMGMITKYARRVAFIDLVFLLYVAVILIYPFGDAGFRFILPVIPFVLYYIVEGIKAVPLLAGLNKRFIAVMLGGIVAMHYVPACMQIYESQEAVLPGPQQFSAEEAFGYIRENTPQEAIVAFAKPRALALYAERKSLINNELDPPAMSAFMQQRTVHYCLVHNELTAPALKSFVQDSTRVSPVWQNQDFALYKVKGSHLSERPVDVLD